MSDGDQTKPTAAPVRRFEWGGPLWRVIVVVAAVAVLYIFVVRWNRWQGDERFETTDDATLQTDLTPLAAQIAGYVRAVPVQDYQAIKAGQLIAQIDDAPYRAAVSQAQAEVEAAQAQIALVQAQHPLLQANQRAAEAAADSTAAALAQNRRDVARTSKLLHGGSASSEMVEKIQTQEAQLAAQLAQNRAQADAVGRQIDLLQAQQQAAQAALAAREAALKLAEINLGYTRITAPADGVIGLRQVFAGEFIAPGTQVTRIASLPQIWVIADYKETQLTRVRPGQKATVTVDTFPDHTLQGHVVAIAPASGAALALLPPDNATGTFTKIVQRVSVKIAIDDAGGLAAMLRPGLSATPSIDTSSGAQP